MRVQRTFLGRSSTLYHSCLLISRWHFYAEQIDKFKLHMAPTLVPTALMINLAPSIANEPERIAKDLKQVRALVTLLEADLDDQRGSAQIEAKHSSAIAENEKEMGENDGVESIVRHPLGSVFTCFIDRSATDDEQSFDSHQTKATLDRYLHYLRTVFNACYYCAALCDYPEELTRICPHHTRKPLPTAELSAATLATGTSSLSDSSSRLLLSNSGAIRLSLSYDIID